MLKKRIIPLSIIAVLSVGGYLISNDDLSSRTLNKLSVHQSEMKVLSKLIETSVEDSVGKYNVDSFGPRRNDTLKHVRKAYLGLSSIYANKDADSFISSSKKNADILISHISSSEPDPIALEMVQRILISNIEERIKHPDAQEVMVKNKKSLFAALAHYHPGDIQNLKSRNFSKVTNNLIKKFENNNKEI